jgi:hypothetical protein
LQSGFEAALLFNGGVALGSNVIQIGSEITDL